MSHSVHICYRCVGTKRVWASRSKLYDFVGARIDLPGYGLRWGMDIMKDWLEDHCLDCEECSL